MSEWVDAAPLDGPDTRMVQADGRYVMLRLDGGIWHATDALCPHKFANLSEGTFGEGCVKCPQHEATFDLQTGKPQAGEEWAGRLPIHEARVQEGRIQVRFTLS